MTSTFRLTRAEFKKIFKKPGVFIMALLLVATIFVSIYVFQPAELINDGFIDYGTTYTNSLDYYNKFYSGTETGTKSSIDLNFDQVDKIISYYSISADRDKNLESYYNAMVTSVDKMREITNDSLRNIEYNTLKTNINNIKLAFNNFDNIESDHVKYTKDLFDHLDEIANNEYALNINQLISITEKNNALDFITAYDTGDFQTKIYKNIQYSINYIKPTLYEKAKNIQDNYNKFNTAHTKGTSSTTNNVVAINNCGIALLKSVKEFQQYFNILVDCNYPTVLLSEALKNEVTDKLDESLVALALYESGGNTTSLPKHTEVLTAINNINLANYFTNTFDMSKNSIKQVKLKAQTLDDFKKIQNKVEENKTIILESINKLRSDESIVSIRSKITEYNLLEMSYDKYINDSVIVTLRGDYNSHEFENLHGYKLKEYNDYQYKERITANRYYLDNNIYSNSLNTNLTFNQNSAQKTTALDFMYFTMELCAVIITIFAMMLICNLITSETESGTIKLLLTRPFKRSKIISAKLLATIFFVIIFVIFSALISFAGGYFLYGFDGTQVLAIFNAKSAFTISPIVLMIIDILSLIIDILFYVFVALMLSIVIKNYAGAITVCLVIMLVTYTLNILFPMAFWYSFLPSMNLHLFKYFGNGFTAVASDTIFQSILITPIQSTMTFLYSILLTIAYSAIALIVSYAVFNKRDF